MAIDPYKAHLHTELVLDSKDYSSSLLREPGLDLQKPSPPRCLSCFCRGFLVILATAIQGLSLPLGCLIPELLPLPDG